MPLFTTRAKEYISFFIGIFYLTNFHNSNIPYDHDTSQPHHHPPNPLDGPRISELYHSDSHPDSNDRMNEP